MSAPLVVSFGFRYGSPHQRQINCEIHDVRRFKNPYHNRKLRQLNGLHPLVQREVLGTPGVMEMINEIVKRRPEVVAFGCTAGRHRSVAIAETVARILGVTAWHMEKENWPK